MSCSAALGAISLSRKSHPGPPRSKRRRQPSLPGTIAAYDENSVAVWGAEDLGVSSDIIAESSCTEVRTTFAAPERERGRTISSEATDAAGELLAEMRVEACSPDRGDR
jgi:electron transfer flavoprotein alpha/beta subunit